MKKSTKKGFTLVELVIVIAIIAILAAVLIPTFSGIVEKANQSAALQKARNAYTEYLANIDYTSETAPVTKDFYIMADGYAFEVDADGKFVAEILKTDVTPAAPVLVDGEMKNGTIAIAATTYKATFTATTPAP